jgi:hypothetical protein
MASFQSYYDLLGISEKATVEEIKKAFRTKAKQYHPDITSDSDAKSKFIQIHEAYEILIHHKTGLIYNNTKEKYQRSRKTTEEEVTNAARSRAESFTTKSYNEYKGSGYYSKSKLVKEATFFVEMIFYSVLFIILPVVLSFFIGIKYASYVLIGLVIFTMPDWIRIAVSAPNVSWERISEGLALVHWPKMTIHWFLFPVSLLIYFTIGFKTFIIMDQVLIIYFVCYSISILYLLLIKKYPNGKNIVSSFSFAFAALCLILALNYFISFDPRDETYDFKSTTFRSSGKNGRIYRGKGSMITLLGDKGFDVYDEFQSIRFFWIYDDIPNEYLNKIVYRTKDGLFSLKIYTDRNFVVIPKPEEE